MMERCVEWGEAEARFREVKITSPCRALVTFHRTETGFTALQCLLQNMMWAWHRYRTNAFPQYRGSADTVV